jgi:HEAT repeat protein
MLYADEAEALKKSTWPRCDTLAAALAAKGASASEALEHAVSSRTHHVRSAVLRNLQVVAPDRARELAKKLLSDRAYEVRETAAEVLGVEKPT